MAKKRKKTSDSELVGFLGVGLDGDDGHQRLTRSDHFVLAGGSAETHEHLQDTVIRFDETLSRQGKTLEELSLEEALEILFRAMDP